MTPTASYFDTSYHVDEDRQFPSIYVSSEYTVNPFRIK